MKNNLIVVFEKLLIPAIRFCNQK